MCSGDDSICKFSLELQHMTYISMPIRVFYAAYKIISYNTHPLRHYSTGRSKGLFVIHSCICIQGLSSTKFMFKVSRQTFVIFNVFYHEGIHIQMQVRTTNNYYNELCKSSNNTSTTDTRILTGYGTVIFLSVINLQTC